MARKIGVGLIGLGSVSHSHEAGFADLPDACRIVALCDVNEDEINAHIGFHEGARGYLRYQELLDDPDVDMVDITVPHPLHHPIAKAALEGGKHVLVEKPIAVRSDQGEELIALAKSKGLWFSVAENTRFVTAYLKAAQILEQGILGEVWSVRTAIAGSEGHRIKDPNLWHGKAPHGGVILDSAVHSFYLYKWLFGGVTEVLGFASKIIPEGQVEDNGLVLGRLATGAEFQLHTSCTAEIPWTERLEVYGSRGGMIVDQLIDPVVKYYLGSNDIDGTTVEGVPFDPLGWKFNSIVAEVKDFVGALHENRPPLVDPADALAALKAVEAVEESIRLQHPVRV